LLSRGSSTLELESRAQLIFQCPGTKTSHPEL